MPRLRRLIGLFTASTLLVGCVSQEKYNALSLERDGLYEQLQKSHSEAAAAQAAAELAKSQLAQLANNGGNSIALIQNLNAEKQSLQQQLDEMNRKYNDAIGRVGTAALPQALDSALKQFASANPDLVEFDSARGMVKFKSDLTFAKGDATLTPKAKEAITRFSQILNSEGASSYDLMVAGHTDNEKVSNPETIRKGNLDNWYLSSHRAISVGSELQKERVSPQRIGVVGYADQRPIASNSTANGMAQNRRVEVLILPTQSRSTAVAGNGAGTGNAIPASATQKPRKAVVDQNKDGAGTPTGLMMNK